MGYQFLQLQAPTRKAVEMIQTKNSLFVAVYNDNETEFSELMFDNNNNIAQQLTFLKNSKNNGYGLKTFLTKDNKYYCISS